MSFTTVEFFFFFPAVLLLYWLGSGRNTVQNLVLLGASYLFYATWSWKLLGLLVVGTVVDFAVGRILDLKGPGGVYLWRRVALGASLAFGLGTLAFFKYYGFFAAEANEILTRLGLMPSLPVLQIALPLGLSYYTLQRLGYVLDVYWGRERACGSLLQFAVFCAFFPQLAAGPISRARELLPQLAVARRLLPQDLASGALQFLVGYMLMAWLASILGLYVVDRVFLDPAAYTVGSHWIALVCYALQVFSDFAGYSLMALGTARFFGIELPINFNFPFLSASLPEFWRRWHISLNRWLFDYIYTPMTTSSGWLRGRLNFALMATFLASGVWHGATWNFVVWGALHGLGMVAHSRWDEFYKSLCRRDRKYVHVRKSFPYKALAWALTMLFFVLTLVPFRAPTSDVALLFAQGLVTSGGRASVHFGFGLALVFGLLLAYHLLQVAPLSAWRGRFFMLPAPIRGASYGAALALLMLITPIGAGTFIYQLF